MGRLLAGRRTLLLVGSACALFAFAACGGRVNGSSSTLAPGTGGSGGSTPPPDLNYSGGSGGNPAPPPDYSGGSGGGGYGSSADAGVGGPVGSEPCTLPWWGTSLEGVVGLTSCPGPMDPALLAYGQTQYPSCLKVTGPTGSKQDGANLSCCYNFDESACSGSGSSSNGCIDLWYFGDGTKQTTIPTTSVKDQLAGCSAPFGTAIVLNNETESANHLIGVWLRCSETGGPTLLRGNGIVFRTDGTFHTLQTDSSGRLVETKDCNQYGLWGFFSTDNQINMVANVGVVLMAHPTFTDGTPRQLRLDGDMGSVDTFVAVQ